IRAPSRYSSVSGSRSTKPSSASVLSVRETWLFSRPSRVATRTTPRPPFAVADSSPSASRTSSARPSVPSAATTVADYASCARRRHAALEQQHSRSLHVVAQGAIAHLGLEPCGGEREQAPRAAGSRLDAAHAHRPNRHHKLGGDGHSRRVESALCSARPEGGERSVRLDAPA